MRIARRRLLLGLAALGTAGGAGIAAAAMSNWRETVIGDIVRTHVPHVHTSPDDMARFAREYITRQGVSDELLAARALLAPVRRRAPWALPASLEGPMRQLDEQATRTFLLATDYFQPGRPVGRVAFVAYPDPYAEGVCGNPLARFDEV